ncbi:MAG: hypothetical protein O2999_05855 [Nitrospirae bacterium]|nr:hypothetical protein [Nitrospirota bacterium]MDA1303809.1 hypothetical protein [Nitrospirota bacterium]
MKTVPKCITIGVFVLAISSTLSFTVMAQAIKPLSGTKGAEAVNNGVTSFNQGNLSNAMSQVSAGLGEKSSFWCCPLQFGINI